MSTAGGSGPFVKELSGFWKRKNKEEKLGKGLKEESRYRVLSLDYKATSQWFLVVALFKNLWWRKVLARRQYLVLIEERLNKARVPGSTSSSLVFCVCPSSGICISVCTSYSSSAHFCGRYTECKRWLSTFFWKLTGETPVSIREGMQQLLIGDLELQSRALSGVHDDGQTHSKRHDPYGCLSPPNWEDSSKGLCYKRRAKMLTSGSLQGPFHTSLVLVRSSAPVSHPLG